MMRRLTGILAAIALLAAIFGVPVALAAWGYYPAGFLALRADDGTLLLSTLTAIGWIAWGLFSVATAVELISQLGPRTIRLPGLSAAQYIAGGLVALALTALPASRLVTPITNAPAGDQVVAAAPSSLPDAAPAAPPLDHPVATDAVETETLAPLSGSTYTVVAGDDLWQVAEHTLGDGRQWRAIVALNPDLDPLKDLVPGTSLTLPQATALSHVAAHLHTTVITVHKGDTLSELAEEHLGKADRWPRIARANPQIADPDHIEIGWKLHLPTLPTAPTLPDAPPRPPSPPSTPVDPQRPHLPDLVEVPPQPQAAPAAPEANQSLSDTANPVAPLTVGTIAAAALIGSLELRRTLRERERPVGRRRPPASEGADQLRTRLHAAEDVDGLTALVAALTAVGQHCHHHDLPLPVLSCARVGKDAVWLDWEGPTSLPPFGFTGDQRHWSAPICPPLPHGDDPCPYPALVSLGTSEDGEVVLVDCEHSRVLGIAGNPAQQQDALAAMAMELACAPWSRDARIVASGPAAELVALAGDDRVHVASPELTLAKLRQVVHRRRGALANADLGVLRVDPERADAVAAYIFCFFQPLPAAQIAEVEALLADPSIGVSVILPVPDQAEATWQVGGPAERPQGRLAGRPGHLAAHAIDAEIREQLAELFTETESELAPWWREDNVFQLPSRDGDDVEIVRLVEPSAHPSLALIGPAELNGAAGQEPARSRQQLIELCAWLLEHPHSTASQMAAGLATAESTRRSNLSRLRNWLGCDADGEPYLPDAYSGRISLHPAITSDWHRLQVMLAGGISRLSTQALVAALELVRGAPLADAAPGQWYWAEELRTQMAGALRDVAVVLTDRALADGDVDLARWAAARALVVAPEDELLLGTRLRTEHRAGNRDEVQRLVTQLTRQARILGVDLLPETVELCQQVIEGRTRVRA